MVPVLTILSAIARAARRELGTFRSLKVNNFFLFIALLVGAALNSGLEPKSAEFLILLLGLLLLVPLSNDPLDLVPASRRGLWPLTRGQRVAMRGLTVTPLFWLRYLIPVSGQFRWMPQFPGRLGGLVRNDLRNILSTLDPYVAMVIAVGCAFYRTSTAAPIMAILVSLTLSTYAQCLFGLDVNGSAMTRYKLLPVRGWEVLLAKDIVFLLVLIPLVLPLHLLTGVTFGLTSLAIGHWPSVRMRGRIYRWRFSGSRLFPSVVQAVVSIVLALNGYWYAAVALYVISLFLAGRYAI